MFERLVQQDFNVIRDYHLTTVLVQVKSVFQEVARALEAQIDLAEVAVQDVITTAQSTLLTVESAREVFLAIETKKANVGLLAKRAIEGLQKVAAEVALGPREESVELVVDSQGDPLAFGVPADREPVFDLDSGVEEQKEAPQPQLKVEVQAPQPLLSSLLEEPPEESALSPLVVEEEKEASRTVSEATVEIPVIQRPEAGKSLKQGVKFKHTFKDEGASVTTLVALPGRDGQYAYTRADGYVYIAKVASKKESVLFKHSLTGNPQVPFTKTLY